MISFTLFPAGKSGIILPWRRNHAGSITISSIPVIISATATVRISGLPLRFTTVLLPATAVSFPVTTVPFAAVLLTAISFTAVIIPAASAAAAAAVSATAHIDPAASATISTCTSATALITAAAAKQQYPNDPIHIVHRIFSFTVYYANLKKLFFSSLFSSLPFFNQLPPDTVKGFFFPLLCKHFQHSLQLFPGVPV